MMKLYVDDIRQAPGDEWAVARTVTDAIRIIAQWDISEISLDHDISHQVAIGKISRPYPCDECFCAVAYFIGLRKIHDANFRPKITIHTANPTGGYKMSNILKDYDMESTTKLSGISNRLEMEV